MLRCPFDAHIGGRRRPPCCERPDSSRCAPIEAPSGSATPLPRLCRQGSTGRLTTPRRIRSVPANELAGASRTGGGCDVGPGGPVPRGALEGGELGVRGMEGEVRRIRASIVVGADGTRSIVAAAAEVARPVRLPRRLGLTYHLEDIEPQRTRDARMRVFRDGYVGVAPGPGG